MARNFHRGFFEELSGFKRGIDHVIDTSKRPDPGQPEDKRAEAEAKRLRRRQKVLENVRKEKENRS